MFRSLKVAALAIAILPILACEDNLFEGVLAFSGPTSEVAFLDVRPDQGVLRIGEVLQLAVVQRDDFGDPVDGGPVVWSSSQPTVAAVNSQGLVSALSVGTANIRASAGGQRATVTISVTP